MLCVSANLAIRKSAEDQRDANRVWAFAVCCGTHLFFEETKDSDTIDLAIAPLDHPAPFAPHNAIFLEDKLPWVTIDESLPSFPKTPKTA
jgi:hypothetical protein